MAAAADTPPDRRLPSEVRFDALPDPPESWTNTMEWSHNEFVKRGGMVYHRELREAFMECFGKWPTLEAPEWLNSAQFDKFCWLVSDDRDQQYSRDRMPKEYVPMDFEDKPEQWAKRKAEDELAETVVGRYGEMLFGGGPARQLNEPSRAYQEATRACDADEMRRILAQFPGQIDPNCVSGKKGDSTIVSIALGHALSGTRVSAAAATAAADAAAAASASEGGVSPLPTREQGLECLRVACSVPGVDVNLDTWWGRTPPILLAINDLDVDIARILVVAGGARVSFEDVFVSGPWRQWSTVLEAPYEHTGGADEVETFQFEPHGPSVMPRHLQSLRDRQRQQQQQQQQQDASSSSTSPSSSSSSSSSSFSSSAETAIANSSSSSSSSPSSIWVAKHRPGALHYCVLSPGAADKDPTQRTPRGMDAARAAMIRFLLEEAGADPLAKSIGELPQTGVDELGTALDAAKGMLEPCGVPVPEGYRGGDWCEAGFTLLLAEAEAENELSERMMMESFGPEGPSKTLEEYRKIFTDNFPEDVMEDELDDAPMWQCLVRCWNKWADYKKKQMDPGQEDPASTASASGATASNKKKTKKKKATKPSPVAVAGAAIGTASAHPAGLLDLDGYMIRTVCGFLDPVEWMSLRQTCPSCRALAGEMPPAPTPFPYKVVLWSVDNGDHHSHQVWHGAAKSLSAAWDGARFVLKQSCTDFTSTAFSFRWVDFDVGTGVDGERRVPISTFDTFYLPDDFSHDEVSRIMEWSEQFLGIKEVGGNLKRAVSRYSYYKNSYHFGNIYLRHGGGGDDDDDDDNVEEITSREILPNKSLLALLLWDKAMPEGEAKVEKFGCHGTGCVLCGLTQRICSCPSEVKYQAQPSQEARPKDVWYNPNPYWVDKRRQSNTDWAPCRYEMVLGPEVPGEAPNGDVGEAQWLIFDTVSASYYD